MKCSSNNRSSTVYNLFRGAVQQFGLPSRVRADQGRENILVAQHMLEHRGVGRGSIITGSSTHNQRIERFWRDLHRCVTVLFYRLFYHLEQLDLLDPVSEIHLYALHYVFLPRINSALNHFQSGWNHHPIRTERNRSPHQLFAVGALSLQHQGLAALDFFDHIDEDYGVEEEGLITEDDVGVEVPELQFRLSDVHLERLRHLVDPLFASDNYGIELYTQAVHFIINMIMQNPVMYSEWIV